MFFFLFQVFWVSIKTWNGFWFVWHGLKDLFSDLNVSIIKFDKRDLSVYVWKREKKSIILRSYVERAHVKEKLKKMSNSLFDSNPTLTNIFNVSN